MKENFILQSEDKTQLVNDGNIAEQVIELENVTKTYVTPINKLKKKINPNSQIKEIKAIENVNLTIPKGIIFGLLGANGSGKTTIIKILCGLIQPSFGKATVLGADMSKTPEKALAQIGAIVEAPTLFKEMTGLENLQYFAMLQGGLPKQRLLDIIELVGLTNRMNSKFSTYSLGMQQRLGIAQAIMHNPKVLILDEPINGLDPEGILQIRELLLRIRKEYGTTIIISSHILSEMQTLCDEVAIMVNGHVAAIKTMAEIEQQSDNSTIAAIICDQPEKALSIIQTIEDVEVKLVDGKVYVKFSGEKMATINKKLVIEDINISAINIKKRTLEDLYKELAK